MQYYTKENVELNVTNSGQSWTETLWKVGGGHATGRYGYSRLLK